MSKQELYAWTSLASSLSISGYYLLTVFGWPEYLSGYTSELTNLFIKVFIIALLIEIILGIMKKKNSVDKDERDEWIAAKGYKVGYFFITGAVSVVLVQLLLNEFLGGGPPDKIMIHSSVQTFHVLILTLFAASILNRGTQIYYYRKAF